MKNPKEMHKEVIPELSLEEEAKPQEQITELQEKKEEEKKGEKKEISQNLTKHQTHIELTKVEEEVSLIETSERDEKKEIKEFINKIIDIIKTTDTIPPEEKKNLKTEFEQIEKIIEKAQKKGEKAIEEIKTTFIKIEKNTRSPEIQKIFQEAQKEINEIFRKKTDTEKKAIAFEKIKGDALLRSIGSPMLIRILQHKEVNKNNILRNLIPEKTAEDREQNEKILKTQIFQLIKSELSKWMGNCLPEVQKIQAKKAQKETKKELGTTGKIENIIESGKKIAQKVLGQGGIDSFPNGSILSLIFSPQESAAFTKTLLEKGDEFAYKLNGEIEINGEKKSVDTILEEKVNRIIGNEMNYEALRKTAGALIPDANHVEDAQFVLKKMQTISEEHIKTAWEKKYYNYIKEKGVYALDFPEWIEQQDISVFERLKFLFKKLWKSFEGIFKTEKEEEPEKTSEIQKQLEKDIEEGQSKVLTETGKQEFEETKKSLLSQYTIESHSNQIKIKNFEDTIEKIEKTNNGLEQLKKIQDLINKERGTDSVLGIALKKDLSLETILVMNQMKTSLSVEKGKLIYKNGNQEKQEIAWTDETIQKTQKEQAKQNIEFENLKHTTDTKIKIDGNEEPFKNVLEEIKTATKNYTEENLSAEKQKLAKLIRSSYNVKKFLENISGINNEELKEEIEDAGLLTVELFEKIKETSFGSIRLNNSKEESGEITINKDIPSWKNIWMGSGDLKIWVNETNTWVDFDSWENFLKIIQNPQAYKNTE